MVIVGEFLFHTSCPKCGSKDNVGVWREPDGSLVLHCFTPSCDYHEVRKSDDGVKPVKTTTKPTDLVPYEFRDLPARGIRQDIAKAYVYGVAKYKGKWVHVANYVDRALNIAAQKIRTENKEFFWLGNKDNLLLFGQHLWLKSGGKMLVITEGEIDALSVAQAFDLSVPVVSIPNGAGGAVKAISQHIDWIESFDKIVLAFDNDKPGKEAIQKSAEILTPGKVFVPNFGKYKDANDVLFAEGPHALRTIIKNATPYAPAGVVLGQELDYDFLVSEPEVTSYEIPYPILNDKLRGLHKKELTLVTAGSGVGKTTFVRELAYHLLVTYPEMKIGFIALEQSLRQAALGFLALDHNIPYGDLNLNAAQITPEMYQKTKPLLERIIFYQHFGSLKSEQLIHSIKYMAQGLGCDFVFLDHISIVVSGLDTHDERKIIDILMTRLRSLVEQTKVGMVVIAHIRKTQNGRSVEEGRQIHIDDLRGSGSLKQLADNVIAIEAVDYDVRQIRVLKNRLFGDIGEADTLLYDRDTGRLITMGENMF